MKSILVTGGGGYIGSHACKKLASLGYSPIVFDNFERGNKDSVIWGDHFVGDLQDENSLNALFEKYSIDAVMHFAAFAYVGESTDNPHMYIKNNVLGTSNLLDAMNKHGVRKMIFSSTCAVYGSPKVIPVSEQSQTKPDSIYGLTKKISEELIFSYMQLGVIDPIVFRYFNVIGSDPNLEIGECHDPETHLIPLAIEAAHKQTPFNVFGNDYETKDGTCIRDYVHVNDIVDAHIRALTYEGKDIIFNIGTGQPYSVLEVLRIVEDVVGQKIDIRFSKRREGDAEALFANSTLLQKKLNWSPKYIDIREAIEHAYGWYKKIHDKY